MIKISVLLATNRLNKNVFPYMKRAVDGIPKLQKNTFTPEFQNLAKKSLLGIKHFIQPTLRSLNSQTFRDFELVISHRYPDDLPDIVDEYEFPIKIIKEKHSIWHDLGEQYHTVANNKNTAFINSSGELIYHIDDLTFFNENLLQEAWDLYQESKYMTGRTVRCITYDKDIYSNNKQEKVGPGKVNITKNGWYGQNKPLIFDYHEHPEIPMNMFWTCSASVSAKELLDINGYEELYDGSLSGIDMDAGNRLFKISKYRRVASDTYLYEIDDPTPKNMVRDDVMMRQLMRVNHTKANSWKPTNVQMKKYKRWHEHTKDKLDINWNKFIDVPIYNIERKK